MLWAFAREGGLPGSKYIARVTVSAPECVLLTHYLHTPGKPTHLPPPLRNRHNSRNQHPPRPHQHRLRRRFRRLHFPHRRKLLLIVHSRRLRDAEQAPYNSRCRYTLGSIQAWEVWCACYDSGDLVFCAWCILFYVADGDESDLGDYELLRFCVWRGVDL